jgi:predicted ATPase/DNA-binding winged helix-turn-helix (wHTH) protein
MTVFVIGGYRLDDVRHELTGPEGPVPVEPQVFDVLRHLLASGGRLVSKEELLATVWGHTFVAESALTTRIKQARRALGDEGATQWAIGTVRGRGYRLVADVTVDEPRQSAEPVVVARLPHVATRLVGREDDVADVCRALERSRLVTVLGPGGVGKSRVALSVAGRLAGRFPDGVHWCDWASVSDEAAAVEALADALDVTRRAGISTELSIVRGVAARTTLVVADNCEHIVDPAARLLDDLVARCPNLHVLATSRSALGVAPERLHPLGPLAVSRDAGESDGLVDAPAPVLFAERAVAADPAFVLADGNRAAVASICRRVDGLPLAIELAAARLRSITVAELAERLEGHFEVLDAGRRGGAVRHQTLHATIDWSYRLLSSAERWTYERLCVFAGGFTDQDARELLLLLGRPPGEVRSQLSGLVDQSIVTADRSAAETRYSVLGTLRAFGLDRLEEAGVRQEVADAHAAWAVGLVEDVREDLRSEGERDAVAHIDRDFANLRAAFWHSARTGNVDAALRLVVGLHLYAAHRLRDEVFTWAEAAVALDGADTHPLTPVALGGLAHGLANRGELERAKALAQRSLAGCDDRDRRALWAWRTLCNVATYDGRLADALPLADRELAIARDAGDIAHASLTLVTKVLANAYGGDVEAALEGAREQRVYAARSGNPTQIGWAAYCHGEVLRMVDPEAAICLFEEALAVGESVDSSFLLGVTLVSLASTRGRLGHRQEALRDFLRIVDLWHRRGDWTHQWTTLRNVVVLLHEVGRDDDAAVLLGAVTGENASTPSYGESRRALSRLRAEVADAMGEDRLADHLERGRGLTPDATVDLARRAIAAAVGDG